jgi:antitoxin HigA-1
MSIKNGLPAVHPGEFLKEMLEDLGTSQAEFARTIGVSSMRVSHVIKGTRPVTAELALLFGKAFGQSPQYWLNLQSAHDLKTAERAMKGRLRGMRRLAHA